MVCNTGKVLSLCYGIDVQGVTYFVCPECWVVLDVSKVDVVSEIRTKRRQDSLT